MRGQRFDRLDALRGLAMVWMALFHFAFDLNHFGLLEPAQNFYRDPFWTVQRATIVTLFMFGARGCRSAVALDAGQAVAALLAPLGADRRLRGARVGRARRGCSRAAGSASACCTASR